jgi:RNA polymerase sigma-70 factor, ECF subfamily
MGTMATELAGVQDVSDALRASTLEEMTNLISARSSYFHRIALRRLDNMADAEDAVQDAFLSAWRHLDKFKGRARLSTWMTVVVMNSARMVARKRGRFLHASLDNPDPAGESLPLSEMLADTRPDPEEDTRRRELEERLLRLSDHLSPNLREVIELCGIEGRSVREAADALGLSITAVKSRAVRARRELRRLDGINPAKVTGLGRRRRAQRRRTSAPLRAETAQATS